MLLYLTFLQTGKLLKLVFGELVNFLLALHMFCFCWQIRNLAAPDLCVDSDHKQRDQVIGLKNCTKGSDKNGEQNFTLTWHKDIRPAGRMLCWDVSDPNDRADVILYPCHGMKGNQYWKYDMVRQLCIHPY